MTQRDTSREALQSVNTQLWRDRTLVCLSYRPMTCDEVEVMVEGTHQNISARITELRKMGLIIDSGSRRKTRSKRNAIVWRLTVKGIKVAARLRSAL